MKYMQVVVYGNNNRKAYYDDLVKIELINNEYIKMLDKDGFNIYLNDETVKKVELQLYSID